jgi:hypothetical protein
VPQRKVEQLVSPLAVGSHDARSREKCGSLTSPMNPLVTGLSPFVGEGGSWVHSQRARN